MKKFCFLVGCLSIFTSGCLKTSLVEPVDPWGPSRSNIEETKITDHEVKEIRKALVENNLNFLPPLKGHRVVPFSDDRSTGRIRPSEGDSVCAILVGDSWAFFDVLYQATEKKLQAVKSNCDTDFIGLTTKNVNTALKYPLAYPGTRAEHWGTKENAQLLVNSLVASNKKAFLVVLYMTGNDIIREYETRQNQATKDSLLKTFAERTENFINFVEEGFRKDREKDDKREIKFLVVGYAQPNLNESLKFKYGEIIYRGITFLDDENYPKPDPWKHPGQEIISKLSLEFSGALDKIEKYFLDAVKGKKNVEFVSNLCEFERNPAKSTPVDKMLYFYWDKVFYNDYFYVDPIHLGKNAQHRIAINTVTRAKDRGWLAEDALPPKPVKGKCDWPKGHPKPGP